MNISILNKRKKILSYRSLRESENKKEKPGDRLAALFDGGKYEELFGDIESTDPNLFPGYREKLKDLQSSTGIKEAVITGAGNVGGNPVIACEMQKDFLMGSMGGALGEKITLSVEEAERRGAALVIFALSGGARMQEGMYALMQMVKTSQAIKRFKDKGGLYISVLTNPTTGGVSASFANLGNIILAEPGALIGFAGPRVIEQTIHQKLPKGFQRAEFQLEHGFVDRIVPREKIRSLIKLLVRMHGDSKIYGAYARHAAVKTEETSKAQNSDRAEQANLRLQTGAQNNEKADCKMQESADQNKGRMIKPYDRLQLARDAARPKVQDYIKALFDDFVELDGDRLGGEDHSMLGGIAYFGTMPVTIIGHRKGRDIKDNVRCNFGMSRPEGYRKALRLMKEAERFGRPVITFIDTPGAYPGMDAEEHGISTAIAENLAEMSTLKVPVIAVVTGEGSSGGALAISVADRIIMLENAVYSVLSPEGFASILWKDGKKAPEACNVMKMTAGELYDAGIIDEVIGEPEGGIQKDPGQCMNKIRAAIASELERLMGLDTETLLAERFEKYRKIGRFN